MTRNHEKLLVAALAGLIIAGAAVFAMQPAIAQSLDAKSFSSRLIAPSYAVLDLRLSDKV
jgi:hypothetical protein